VTDAADRPAHPPSRWLAITEAVVLAVVAVLAAWSGFAAARFSTESRLALARASTTRAEANAASARAESDRNFDASTFNTWFTAMVVDNQPAADVAERRFRAELEVAFDAWMATDPLHNPDAPPGPTYMPEYVLPDVAKAADLERQAEQATTEGNEDAGHADDYVRTTVVLATVLFLAGISGHFSVDAARIGLLAVAGSILVFAVVSLVLAPKPPW